MKHENNESYYYQRGENQWLEVAGRVAMMMEPDWQAETLDAVSRKLFLPSTPILRNAPGFLNMVSCHNLQVANSVEGIWQAAKETAIILKSGGGGVGLEFSKLAASTSAPLKRIYHGTGINGRPTGPVSFLELFDITGAMIGRSRSGKPSGLMGLLSAHHPDAEQWVRIKDSDGNFSVFNLSVSLRNVPDSIAPDLWQTICQQAWKNGTPGVVFLDNVNAQNPMMREYGPIETVNVCAENPGYPYASCVLGSLVLPNLIDARMDFIELQRVTRLAVRILDRVIEVNPYPLAQLRERAEDLRRIGIGVMGANEIYQLAGLRYGSQEANALASEIAATIMSAAIEESKALGREKGGYRPHHRRNVSLMALAPNGHIGRLVNCSPSIYMDLYDKEQYAQYLGMCHRAHIDHIHAWQRYVDGGISYTVTLPHDSTPTDVDDLFRYAHASGLKAISVYRDGSRQGQPCESCEIDLPE
jgi:ribonucleoside-diphosphate reductase alpha chain